MVLRVKAPACQCRRCKRHSLGRSPGGGHGHSSILAWKVPWTKESGELQSIESDTNEVTKHSTWIVPQARAETSSWVFFPLCPFCVFSLDYSSSSWWRRAPFLMSIMLPARVKFLGLFFFSIYNVPWGHLVWIFLSILLLKGFLWFIYILLILASVLFFFLIGKTCYS